MPRLEILIALQDVDLKRAKIQHKAQNLPQRETLAEAEAESLALEPAEAELAAQLEAIEERQRGREKESARLSQKIQDDSQRLYDGTITSPKEATALSHEIETLQEHLRVEEDAALELMEQADPIFTQLDDLHAKQAALTERKAELLDQIAAAEAEAAKENEAALAQRNKLVAAIEEDLLALYDSYQKNAAGPVVVGLLEGGVCTACNLSMSSGERDRIKSLDIDEPADCPECRALLVRTAGTG